MKRWAALRVAGVAPGTALCGKVAFRRRCDVTDSERIAAIELAYRRWAVARFYAEWAEELEPDVPSDWRANEAKALGELLALCEPAGYSEVGDALHDALGSTACVLWSETDWPETEQEVSP